MHLSVFTARCYAERGIAMAKLSVRLSVTLRYRDHIQVGWNFSKIISLLVSPGYSLFATQTSRVYSKGNTPKFFPNRGGVLKRWVSAHKSCNISEMRQNTKVIGL